MMFLEIKNNLNNLLSNYNKVKIQKKFYNNKFYNNQMKMYNKMGIKMNNKKKINNRNKENNKINNNNLRFNASQQES